MPNVRPFRALRYDPASIGDLGAVMAPPYDVVDPAVRSRLVARHPANVVQLDLPTEEPGDEPDDRYRRTARLFADVAVGRDAAQGPPSVGLRLRAGLSRPGHDDGADAAWVLRPAPARGVR